MVAAHDGSVRLKPLKMIEISHTTRDWKGMVLAVKTKYRTNDEAKAKHDFDIITRSNERGTFRRNSLCDDICSLKTYSAPISSTIRRTVII